MEDAARKIRVIIADDEPITRMDLKEILEAEQYQVVGEAADGFDVVELCKQLHPDLVLMDIKMPLLDGLSAAHIIFYENLADTVILLTAYSERVFIDEAKSVGVSGYLVKPIDEKSLIPSIELSVARSKEIKKLKKDIAKVSERLENRGIIEKAKGKIMEQHNMTEQDAYDYIRNLSLTKNLSMRRVAEFVLLKN
ncbi:response regulator receiver and ANTAR domain protein [Hydrogenoanaerobacterium saccharovorans]|uniref:Stage 0 sporulation protein A homolog n=1 Tax=Hydrogenoanaerobacterium saccharovorans TaxID=474960 RepID=A0A1H7ZJY3_9FIRM|nr:response regulator [Hydrogenoanaerobacterium saccharovorans]RPF48593.1 response regulator receiver and ANTAR domain protein [Hydrogenoanaerobacterium saccharovorans]SEM57789.1 response regulator receiver and ANTAR domain protein [Hydrogenoanaerobacterium saccharovorans]